MFPSNFVEELPPLPDAEVQEIKPKPVKGVGLGDILRDAKSRPPPPQLPRPPDPTPAPQLPPKPGQWAAGGTGVCPAPVGVFGCVPRPGMGLGRRLFSWVLVNP